MFPTQHLVFQGSIYKFYQLEDLQSRFETLKSLDGSGGALAGKASRGLDNQSLFPTMPFPRTVREGGLSKSGKKMFPSWRSRNSLLSWVWSILKNPFWCKIGLLTACSLEVLLPLKKSGTVGEYDLSERCQSPQVVLAHQLVVFKP